MHVLINNLSYNSEIFPAFIDLNNITDLFILQNFSKISWFIFQSIENLNFIRISNFQGTSNLNEKMETIYNNETFKSIPFVSDSNQHKHSSLLTISSVFKTYFEIIHFFKKGSNPTFFICKPIYK